MIDEKKLIEYINEEFCHDCTKCGNGCRLAEIEWAISKQPKVGEWIPCSERLPEEYTEVLGCDRYGDSYIVRMYDTNIYGKVWKQRGGGELMLTCIVAWQPLPQPYREKVE